MKLKYIKSTVLIAFMSIIIPSNEEINESLKYLIEQQNKILKKVNSMEARQKLLEKKITTIEKQGGGKKAANNKRQAPDPNKRYNVKVGDSIVLGNRNAKATLIEWTDFQ